MTEIGSAKGNTDRVGLTRKRGKHTFVGAFKAIVSARFRAYAHGRQSTQ